MEPQASTRSVGGNEQVAQGDDCDLNQLARQMLGSVPDNALPPEPFPSGFDLGALASTRSSRPPAGTADAEARLDLRSTLRPTPQPQRPSAPPPTLPPAKRSAVVDLAPGQSNKASALRHRLPARKRTVVDLAPSPVAQAQPQHKPQPAEDELEALLAARSFAGAAWSEHVARAVSIAKQAPNWAWGAGGALLVALVWLTSTSGSSRASAPPPVAAVASAPSIADTRPAPVNSLFSMQLPHAAGVSATPRADMRAAYDRAHPAHSSPTATATPAHPSTREQPQAPVAKAGSAEERTIDTLLDEALRKEGSPVPVPDAQRVKSSGLPALPSRSAVADIFGGLMPRLRFCAGDRTGVAIAHVIVRKDGQVTNVHVSGAGFSSTASGSCMESVLRGAHFPAFEQPTFRVTYPFQL